jgi:hypothetical protein
MEELTSKAFDFSIRSIELVRYLEEEKNIFPLANRLLDCSEGICVALRMAGRLAKTARENYGQAFRMSMEAECLLELMVKTGFLSEKQSVPILTDCRSLIVETEKLFLRNAG